MCIVTGPAENNSPQMALVPRDGRVGGWEDGPRGVTLPRPGSVLPRPLPSPAFPVEQARHAAAHLVPDLADALEGLIRRIRERPVLSTQPRHDRALLPAAHRDQQVGAPAQLRREP